MNDKVKNEIELQDLTKSLDELILDYANRAALSEHKKDSEGKNFDGGLEDFLSKNKLKFDKDKVKDKYKIAKKYWGDLYNAVDQKKESDVDSLKSSLSANFRGETLESRPLDAKIQANIDGYRAYADLSEDRQKEYEGYALDFAKMSLDTLGGLNKSDFSKGLSSKFPELKNDVLRDQMVGKYFGLAENVQKSIQKTNFTDEKELSDLTQQLVDQLSDKGKKTFVDIAQDYALDKFIPRDDENLAPEQINDCLDGLADLKSIEGQWKFGNKIEKAEDDLLSYVKEGIKKNVEKNDLPTAKTTIDEISLGDDVKTPIKREIFVDGFKNLGKCSSDQFRKNFKTLEELYKDLPEKEKGVDPNQGKALDALHKGLAKSEGNIDVKTTLDKANQAVAMNERVKAALLDYVSKNDSEEVGKDDLKLEQSTWGNIKRATGMQYTQDALKDFLSDDVNNVYEKGAKVSVDALRKSLGITNDEYGRAILQKEGKKIEEQLKDPKAQTDAQKETQQVKTTPMTKSDELKEMLAESLLRASGNTNPSKILNNSPKAKEALMKRVDKILDNSGIKDKDNLTEDIIKSKKGPLEENIKTQAEQLLAQTGRQAYGKGTDGIDMRSRTGDNKYYREYTNNLDHTTLADKMEEALKFEHDKDNRSTAKGVGAGLANFAKGTYRVGRDIIAGGAKGLVDSLFDKESTQKFFNTMGTILYAVAAVACVAALLGSGGLVGAALPAIGVGLLGAASKSFASSLGEKEEKEITLKHIKNVDLDKELGKGKQNTHEVGVGDDKSVGQDKEQEKGKGNASVGTEIKGTHEKSTSTQNPILDIKTELSEKTKQEVQTLLASKEMRDFQKNLADVKVTKDVDYLNLETSKPKTGPKFEYIHTKSGGMSK